MDVYHILFLILSLLFIFVLFVTWNDNYWLKRRIPFIEPKKFFGNIKDVVLMKKTIGQVYQEIYIKLGDKPLGGFFKLRQPILMIKHPDLIKEVLVDKFDCFNANDINVRRDANPILKMNPVLSSGATWRASKSVLTPLTSDKTLEGMFTIAKKVSQDMMEFVKKYNLPVECKELSSGYVSDVIAGCALGTDPNTFKDVDEKFKMMSGKIFKNSVRSNIAMLFALYAPYLSNWFSYRIIPKKITTYFIMLIADLCKYRVRESIERNDFLQHLININKESEANGEGTVYNYDKITAYCMTVLINGYFKTTSPFYYCLYEIASNVEIQNKLKDELKNHKIYKMSDFTSDKINELTYLDMVLNEAFRLHPSVQVVTRLCTKETLLRHDGLEYKIEIGTPVTIPIYALHMDPEYYKDPKAFIPERFTKEASSERNDYTYLPFGKGPRECPGRRFGKMILKTAIVSILLQFRIEPRYPLVELKQDPKSSLLNAAQGDVMLKFKEEPLTS